MIESIEVKNYKILDFIQIKDLVQINIFVGKNNCGKTSLLEATFLNFKPSNPMLIVSAIANFTREIQLRDDNLDMFFYQLNMDKPIEIISCYNQQKMHLVITPKITNDFAQILPSDTNFLAYQSNTPLTMGLKFDIQFDGHDSARSSFDIHGNNINNVMEAYYPSFSGMLMPSNMAFININNILNKLRTLKKERNLVQYLQIFDEQIKGVEVINGEIMIDLENMPKKISLNTMGEGFKKYLAIIASMIIGEYKYICIDEIENGLHFETMQKLLESIIELAKYLNIQLFISTHSYELLEILNKTSNEKQYSEVAVFNIAKTKNKGLQAYKYNLKDLGNLLHTKTEFRD